MKKSDNMTFGQWREYENSRKQINEASWFGLITGLVLTLFFGYKSFWYDNTIIIIVFRSLAVLSIYLFVLGGFFPHMLFSVTEKVKKIANYIGKFILKIILVPIYAILFIVSLFFKKKTSKRYEFYSWDSTDDAPEPKYSDYESVEIKPHRSSMLGTLNRIIYVFAKNKLYFLLPLVLFLLVLGLIFFFLSSSSVFGFVYTLF